MKPIELKHGQEVLIALEQGVPVYCNEDGDERQRAFKVIVCEPTERGLFVAIDCFHYFEWSEIRDCTETTRNKEPS